MQLLKSETTLSAYLSLNNVFVVIGVSADQLAVQLGALVAARGSRGHFLALRQVEVGWRENFSARDAEGQQKQRDRLRHPVRAASRRRMTALLYRGHIVRPNPAPAHHLLQGLQYAVHTPHQ